MLIDGIVDDGGREMIRSAPQSRGKSDAHSIL